MEKSKYQLKKELRIKDLALCEIESQLDGTKVVDWDLKELIDLLELKSDLKLDIETLRDELESMED